MSVLEVTEPLPPEATVPPDEGGPAGRRGGPSWARFPPSLRQPESLLTLAIVTFLCWFVFKELQPAKLLLDSTPAGGDMGAHVWQPAFLRDHLLGHFRLTGWAPDWYAGFPSLVFYFPLPTLMIVILGAVMPYNVAFKLVSVAGLVTMPLAAWAFGRLARFRFPGPVCLAAATLPFLFARNYTIYGGNIASTLAGEFGFSLSMTASIIFLGLVMRGLETGKYRAWASMALLVTGLCHLLPAIFAIVGAIVLTIMRWDRRSWRWMAPVFAVAGGLAAFWWLPFLFRLPYATDMGYEKLREYGKNLIPGHMWWLFALAPLGVVLSFIRRQKVGIFFTIMAALSVLIFRFAPQARLWNARVLPFWFLSLYLLAGIAVCETGAILFEPLRPDRPSLRSRWSTAAVAVVAALAAFGWVGFPLHALPFGRVSATTGKYQWMGISSSDSSFIPSWAQWNYSGYESSGKSRRDEYFGLLKTMGDLGRTEGCGRAMWEYEPQLDQMGTPDALMLLPYWTNGCIGSMEGLYYESSATTPYHFINAAELSLQPSDPVRGLHYPSSPNVTDGTHHLQLLGVKYYMALTPETQMQADTNPDLRLVDSSGPWPVSYASGPSTGVKERTWKIYVVSDSQVVTPLVNQPVVMKGVADGGQSWLKSSEAWYLNPGVSDVLYAASGPRSWSRIEPSSAEPPRTALQPVQVDHISTSDNSVSFDVDTIGVPVLVKVSYFPNWQAAGAKGPYRVAPNLMVVIPTSHHVRLHYGYTPLDWGGYLMGVLALGWLVWLIRAKPVAFANRRAQLILPVPDDGPTLTDPYLRLEHELAAAGGGRGEELDAWLGFPAGLDPDHPSAAAGADGTGPPPAVPGADADHGSDRVDHVEQPAGELDRTDDGGTG